MRKPLNERVLHADFRDNALKDLARGFTDMMLEAGLFKSCLNCWQWKEKEEICGKYSRRPPAKIIVSGCPEHEDLPF